MKPLKNVFKFFYNPFTIFIHECWAVLCPKLYAKYLYKKILNKNLNLDNPKDFNEKIQWLKIYSDTSQWTELADKYKVRKYLEQCGYGNILVKLYGVWEKAEDINFDALPDQFVFKTNQAFGRTIIVKDKSLLNIRGTKILLNKWVKEKHGLVSFEPHYWNIERRILAEEYLEDICNTISTSIIDYKFWCLQGEPFFVSVLYNRNNFTVGSENKIESETQMCVYDLDWNLHPEIMAGSHANDTPILIPKPTCFDEMILICKRLSKPFPQVRVDLYEVNDKVYFGELTFTPGGNMDYFTYETFKKMGERIDLSTAKLRTKRFII